MHIKMISAPLSFNELLESVKDETGIKNLRPYYERIKRFVFRAEEQIGFSGAVVLKAVVYTNDETNYNGKSFIFPSDCVELFGVWDQVNGCEINSCYYERAGNYIHFLGDESPEEFALYYYGLLCDGLGAPITTRNHQDAVVNYIKWKLIGGKAFLEMDRTKRALEKDYEQDWKDARDAALGNDVWPVGKAQWDQLSETLSYGSAQAWTYEIYTGLEKLLAIESKSECVLKEAQKNQKVYSWQFDNTVDSIDIAPTIDNSYLTDNTTENDIKTFLEGITIPYSKVGRIALAVQDVVADEYRIYDVLQQRVDNIVFDKYYNEILKLQIYISKEFYSYSNIFFKFKETP